MMQNKYLLHGVKFKKKKRNHHHLKHQIVGKGSTLYTSIIPSAFMMNIIIFIDMLLQNLHTTSPHVTHSALLLGFYDLSSLCAA